jgi:hypothetical protein
MEDSLVQLSMTDEAALVLGRRVIRLVSPHQRQAFDFVAGRRLGLAPMRPEGGRKAEGSLIRLLLPAVQDAIGDLAKHLVRAGVGDAERRLATRLAGYPVAEGSDSLPLTDRRVRQAATRGARRRGLSKEAARTLGTS